MGPYLLTRQKKKKRGEGKAKARQGYGAVPAGDGMEDKMRCAAGRRNVASWGRS